MVGAFRRNGATPALDFLVRESFRVWRGTACGIDVTGFDVAQ